jgi:segregation and condensation protein B
MKNDTSDESLSPESTAKPAAEEKEASASKSEKRSLKKRKSLDLSRAQIAQPAEELTVADVVLDVEAAVEATENAPNSATETGESAEADLQAKAREVDSECADENADSVEAEAGLAETAVEPHNEADGEPVQELDWDELKRNVEALLFAADEPVTEREIASAIGDRTARVRKALKEIAETCDIERRPWTPIQTAGGLRLATRPEYFPVLKKLRGRKVQRKLSPAALESLALVAYRQPLSRAEIEAVRGVGAGPVLRQLLERRLLKITGRGVGLGRPLLYGTTDEFLNVFGLKSLDELPRPDEFKNT